MRASIIVIILNHHDHHEHGHGHDDPDDIIGGGGQVSKVSHWQGTSPDTTCHANDHGDDDQEEEEDDEH